MSGTADEDIDLIRRFLVHVPSGEDRNALLEYALVLSELRGEDSGRYREQLSDELRSAQGLAGRLPPDKDQTLSDPCTGPSVAEKEDFFRYLAYHEWEKNTLLPWLDRAHTLHSGLLDSPEWIFQMIRVLNLYGLSPEAEEYRVQLLTRFPASLEADLLRGRVSLLPGPSDLIGAGTATLLKAADPPDGEASSLEDAEEKSPEYIQVGAFSKLENARILREQLGAEGLESRIGEENGIFKLIIISRDESLTVNVMERLNLTGFRIPRIP